MKRRSVVIALALAAEAACRTSFDAELHEGARSHIQPLSAVAPSFAYELIVIAPSDKVGRINGPVAFGERVGRELDELLRERGVRPTRLEATPVAGRWLRLILTRGRERIRLKSERWEGNRLLGSDEHATPVQRAREDVGLLLDRILDGVATPSQ